MEATPFCTSSPLPFGRNAWFWSRNSHTRFHELHHTSLCGVLVHDILAEMHGFGATIATRHFTIYFTRPTFSAVLYIQCAILGEEVPISEATEVKIDRFSGLQHGFYMTCTATPAVFASTIAVSASEWNFCTLFIPFYPLLALLG